jgi:hypothetical protein
MWPMGRSPKSKIHRGSGPNEASIVDSDPCGNFPGLNKRSCLGLRLGVRWVASSRGVSRDVGLINDLALRGSPGSFGTWMI